VIFERSEQQRNATCRSFTAVTEGGVWEAAGDTRLREAKTGKNAGTANRAAAAAARGTSTIIPGRAMAAVTTASMEGTARAGSATLTGGIATVAAAADMVADTAADMLPATVAVLGAGVAVAAAAVGTNRPCPMRQSVWMQHRVISTQFFQFFFASNFAPRLVFFFMS
jgi:hypothetical protein